MLEYCATYFMDNEIGEFLCLLGIIPQENLQIDFVRATIERAISAVKRVPTKFSRSTVSIMFKLMHLCGYNSKDYIELFKNLGGEIILVNLSAL